ncbi:hypothetical protein L9F63_008922, partial [Diploptera punctata]
RFIVIFVLLLIFKQEDVSSGIILVHVKTGKFNFYRYFSAELFTVHSLFLLSAIGNIELTNDELFATLDSLTFCNHPLI